MSSVFDDVISISVLDGTFKYYTHRFLFAPSELSSSTPSAESNDSRRPSNGSPRPHNEYLFLDNARIPSAVWSMDIGSSVSTSEDRHNELSPNYTGADAGYSTYVGDLDGFLAGLGLIGPSPFLGVGHICAPSENDGCLVIGTVSQSRNGPARQEEPSGSSNTDQNLERFAPPAGQFAFSHSGSGAIYVPSAHWQAFPNGGLLGCALWNPLCLPATVAPTSIDSDVSSIVEPTPEPGSLASDPPPDFTSNPQGGPAPDFPFAPLAPSVPEGSTLTLTAIAFAAIALAFYKETCVTSCNDGNPRSRGRDDVERSAAQRGEPASYCLPAAKGVGRARLSAEAAGSENPIR
jgi:hypothetical protein